MGQEIGDWNNLLCAKLLILRVGGTDNHPVYVTSAKRKAVVRGSGRSPLLRSAKLAGTTRPGHRRQTGAAPRGARGPQAEADPASRKRLRARRRDGRDGECVRSCREFAKRMRCSHFQSCRSHFRI